MLKLATEFEDKLIGLHCVIKDWVACTPDKKTYMFKSHGRRMAGRRTRYYLALDGECKRFMASNDREAVNKANEILTKQAAEAGRVSE